MRSTKHRGSSGRALTRLVLLRTSPVVLLPGPGPERDALVVEDVGELRQRTLEARHLKRRHVDLKFILRCCSSVGRAIFKGPSLLQLS